jgi:hypothetical protein
MRAKIVGSLLCTILSFSLSPQPAHAVAGKWTPEQILEHDPVWLAELGLEIPPGELWDPEVGGLLEAVVQISGCSSGFVSAEGLIVTNHHCAFGILQEHSTPDRDLITGGFLAAGRSGELSGTGQRATVPHRFTDVSAVIEGSVPEGADDLERYEAIDRAKKDLVAECEAAPFRRCRLATYDDGVQYVLIEALEFRDVRLVFAPPRALGEYGGEIDNWMWPRHTGDFALLRVYAGEDNQPAEHTPENLPYRPRKHLQIAREGVADGDFVMVVGYPGRTYRSLVAEEMAERAELYFPGRAALYRHWLDIMNEASAVDDEAEIALASRAKSLANREKNARGQVEAIARGSLLEKKRAVETEALIWMAERPELEAATEAHAELTRSMADYRAATWDRSFLLQQADSGPLDLALAVKLARWALEREKPDLERDADYQERNRHRLLESQKVSQKRLHPATDRILLLDYLGRLAALPAGQRLSAVETLLDGEATPESLGRAVDFLLDGTEIFDLDVRLAMFEENAEELREREDPLIDFAFDLNRDILEMEKVWHRRDGEESRLRPAWRRALRAYLDRPLDPDANGTLRVSLAHVEGYRPRDAVFMTPVTRLSGLVEKHTDEEPFDAPDEILAAAPEAGSSRWAERSIGDVAVCFLATGDTTGGSSGSPVLNGRGELVGVNFDRVWENIANDFGYNPEIARNVSADVRYLLWILEEIEGEAAAGLIEELGLAEE